jgi:RHS repeat-associated protein
LPQSVGHKVIEPTALTRGLTVVVELQVTVPFNGSRLKSLTYGTGGSCTSPPGNLGNLAYTYDAVGQRTQLTGSGSIYPGISLPATATATYDVANEVLSWNGIGCGGTVSCFYDNNGNLTVDPSPANRVLAAWSWDERNQLTSIPLYTGSVSFSYDAFGRRLQKTLSGTTTSLLYDGLDPIQDAGVGANILDGLGLDEIFSRSDSSGTMSYLKDALGSTVALINSSGGVSAQYKYDPFGNTTTVTDATSNTYKFTGCELDTPAPVYYLRARYYHATMQRFVSPDPFQTHWGLPGGT